MKDKLNLNYPYNKFYPGILRWSRDGEIDLDTDKGVARVVALLKVICNSPAFDFYDGDFNGQSFEAVKNSVNIDLDAEEYHSEDPHRYRIERIASFVQARKYREYAPDWCILESRSPTTGIPTMERTVLISTSGTTWRRYLPSPEKTFRTMSTGFP